MSIEAMKQMVAALEDIKDDCSGDEFEWQNDYPLQCAALEAGRQAIALRDVDESMYRHTVAQRDAAWREIEALKRTLDYERKRHEAFLKSFTTLAAHIANPPMLIVRESEIDKTALETIMAGRPQ